MTAAELAARLEARRNGSGWAAHCPAHEDRRASLSIGEGTNGRALLKCHAGCDLGAILDKLGLTEADLFPPRETRIAPAPVLKVTRHEVKDAAGVLVAVHFREDLADGSKRMWWARPDGARGLNGTPSAALPLYGSEHLAGLNPEAGVIVTEGEKAADAIRGLRLPAVGTVTGAAGCPDRAALEPLRGRRVFPWPDADAPGQQHMDRFAQALVGIAGEVRLVTWGEPGSKADAADFVAAGGTREQLIELLKAAPTWEPMRPAPAGDEAATGPVLVRVSAVAAETVHWLWLHRIPLGKVTVLDGDPGLGKSTLTLDLAARVSRGLPMPGEEHTRVPAGVVLLSAEDGIGDTIRPRLEAGGADLERVAVLTAVRDAEGKPRLPVIPDDVGAMRDALRQVRASLLVIDPLMAFLNGRVDSHRDQDVRGALHLLADLAESEGASVLIVRHLNKAGGGHPIYRGGGSIGIIGAARAALLVAPDPKDESGRVLAVSKSNLGPVPPSLAYRLVQSGEASRIEWKGVAEGCSARDLLAAQRDDGEGTGPRDEAEAFLRELLHVGPIPARKVRAESEGAGLAWATIRRAADRIGVNRDKAGMTSGWYWSLSADAEGAHSVAEGAEDAHRESVSTFGKREHLRAEANDVEIIS